MHILQDTATLPETGFLRLAQIIGNPKTGSYPLIPVCRASWWNGVKAGRFPPPVKLGPNTTVWRVEDIRQLIADGRWQAPPTEPAGQPLRSGNSDG